MFPAGSEELKEIVRSPHSLFDIHAHQFARLVHAQTSEPSTPVPLLYAMLFQSGEHICLSSKTAEFSTIVGKRGILIPSKKV